ncbi:MAG: CDP-diacylglycerol--glycerol-3-phosphate 3-phosphatidyltransferase [Candidatus Omnitrophica bacterium]|nr:CDP-diacylglycerol--glycerol-3-phosphate 3-phosphatidyltransferase [Candidatus Omnitrophota bacterium]MCM8831189.1 CDP-diacylglycerol--glycerol-3-phosphate 3-phosphatidyltransferase [Candidatus Omnitrophota bacterium]
MNISNKLTFLRIILALVCIGFILQNTFTSIIIAFLIFIFASFTDFLDGYLARQKNIISDLGKIIDPIADKILIIGIFLAFLQIKVVINVWMVTAIVLREFIITGLRLYCLSKGEVLGAERWGKHKTVSQVIGVFVIFITFIFYKKFPYNNFVLFLYTKLIHFLMWYIVFITLFSGIYYFWKNRRLVRTF